MRNSIILILIIFIFSCSSDPSSSVPKVQETSSLSGKEVYKMYCVACHGADGTLEFSGATNLQTSTLAYEDRIDQITNGKGAMNPFTGILTPKEIEAVANYIETLRK